MKKLNIREVREALPQLERLLVEHGEVLIARHGRPVARLVPLAVGGPRPSHADLRARMPRLRAGSESALREERAGR